MPGIVVPVPMDLSTATRAPALLTFAVLYLPWLLVDFCLSLRTPLSET
jgi:hypothetical protein